MIGNTRLKTGHVVGIATVSAAALALTACSPFGATNGPVGFDGVQSATIQLEAVGSFVSPEEGGYESAGRGSGFIITPDGLAVTNNHVVTGAGTLKVWRGGDKDDELSAKVLGSSECLDLAVVQLQKGAYPFMDWHQGDIKTALEVYAAGFPLGDPTFTETKGIVSKAKTGGETPWASIDTVIEHDARIRPGNSGGPLVDAKGAVVGVNYAGNDENDTNFAIHRDEVVDAIHDLAHGKNVLSLGVNGEALTDDEGTGLGIWVNSVASGSAADKAGIEPGDLLTKLEGVSLGTDGTMKDYCDVLRTHGQDATLGVEVYRPSEEAYYRGQVNGDALRVVPGLSTGSSDDSGDDSGDSAGDYTTITDDSGTISVDVPTSWTQVDGAASTDDAGTPYEAVSASADLDGFQNGWGASGVSIYTSQQSTLSPDAGADLLADGATDAGCVSNGRQPYDDGAHQGVWEIFTGCGGSATYVVVSAQATDGSYSVLVAAQAASEADYPAIDKALGTFYAEY
ncbi:trypsin-like peptidase domain-containing protein [Rathayibacter sp. YIM 133350]|uniref:S1C family serine protease n=1 Tax=Rathayibacter sp. YIM 133350 TaxID=3131992 RepID=UPI00307EBE43